MGLDLAEKYPTAQALFDRANEALGYDLTQVCFEGPEDALTQTATAQPGIFLVSWVALELLKEQVPDLSFEATAGLSLGEFTALTTAGVMSFDDGLRVVRQRGRFMQEACDATEGGMAAVIGLDEAATREVCAAAEADNLHGAVGNFRNFQCEQLDHKFGSRAGKDYFRSASGFFHRLHIAA